jgi:hypothetical protein
MTRLKIFGVIAALSLVSACAPTSRFEWGGYEGALFAYSKHPESREAYRQSLKQAIDAGKTGNRLAPGLYAELGFLSLEDGDRVAAETFFNQEMSAFPESTTFLKGVMARKSGAPPTAQPPSQSATPPTVPIPNTKGR